MNDKLVLIVDIYKHKNLNSECDTFEQKTLSFSLIMVKWILKQNAGKQIAIIINRKKKIRQACHFTNNNLHFIQGLFNIIRAQFCSYNNINFPLLFAKRLINFVSQNKNGEIVFINPFFSISSFSFLVGNLIKNKNKLSMLEINKKPFICEIICRLTGGVCVNRNLHKKKTLCLLKSNSLKEKKRPAANYLTLGEGKKKISNFYFLNKKIDFKINKILNYCCLCKINLINAQHKYCFHCGLAFLEILPTCETNLRNLKSNLSNFFSAFNCE